MTEEHASMHLLVVRHGKAGSRHDWEGRDEQRPLSKRGRRQAEALVNLLADRPIARVLSSSSLRCIQTVEPLAQKLGLTVVPREALREGATRAQVAELLAELSSTTAVVCTHGDMIPIILDHLATEHGFDLPDPSPCAKGSTWEVNDEQGPKTARYLPAPE